MSIINRVPKGYLSALDAKTGGQTPANTADILSPVIDLTDYYLADLTLRGEGATENVTIADLTLLTAQVEVPAGELWAVKMVSGGFFITAGANGGDWSCQPAFRSNQSALSVQFLATNNIISTLGQWGIGEGVNIPAVFERPFLATPGTIFGTWVTATAPAGQTATTSTSVSFYRLEV